MQKKVNVSYDYDRDTLFRVSLIECPSKNVLLIGYHHVVGDGKTGMILCNDLL